MLLSLAVTLSLTVSALAAPHEKRARAQVISHCTVPNTIALTFDDGPHVYLRDIVNILDSNGAKGTFFFNGENYGCIYSPTNADDIKYTYDHGHQVASHTWAHKDLTTLTKEQIDYEMLRVEEALTRITGANPAFMRPPYGNYNDLVLDVSGLRKQTVVIWDFDTQDSLGASTSKQKSLIDGLIHNHPSTVLSLQHEVYESTAHDVLPYFIQNLKTAGYRMVTLAECIGKNPYQRVVAPSPRNGDWHC
ncbi:carbohydrate esterase family 4 protein [Crucibulum laeve]|uniref:Carbohydrate esterase family 4 protein n=1 Tax=Crucibulum laeve TaxID=68775 RepID=A0A5C3LY19_9AGAR|nr:carbohydrate esterase family 4 protein [Crucibulum laeve]